MRIPSTRFQPGNQHGFGSRHSRYRAIGASLLLLKRWFSHATDRSIGTQLCDLNLNPFLFITESGC